MPGAIGVEPSVRSVLASEQFRELLRYYTLRFLHPACAQDSLARHTAEAAQSSGGPYYSTSALLAQLAAWETDGAGQVLDTL